MTVADLDERDLRECALRLVAAGKLPSSEPAVTWAGSGRGEPCCVCQMLVRPDEIGFDLEFRMPQRQVELHMHGRCRIAWEQAQNRSS